MENLFFRISFSKDNSFIMIYPSLLSAVGGQPLLVKSSASHSNQEKKNKVEIHKLGVFFGN